MTFGKVETLAEQAHIEDLKFFPDIEKKLLDWGVQTVRTLITEIDACKLKERGFNHGEIRAIRLRLHTFGLHLRDDQNAVRLPRTPKPMPENGFDIGLAMY